MSEYKPGLHKKISAIFNGVPIPGADDASPPPYAPQKNQALAVAEPQVSAQQPAPPPEKTAPQPSASVPQPAPSSAKPASQKQQKADAPAVAGQSPIQKFLTQLKARLFKSASGIGSVRQKMMIILVPVLFIIFIFVFVRLFSAPARKTAKPPKAVKTDTAAVVAAGKINWKIPDPWPETIRDPMKLGSSAVDSPENTAIVVRGIVYSEDNPAVIIGTQLMHQGDKVAGAAITKITEDNVEFETNGKKWTQKVQH
jgi:hypothetical protein